MCTPSGKLAALCSWQAARPSLLMACAKSSTAWLTALQALEDALAALPLSALNSSVTSCSSARVGSLQPSHKTGYQVHDHCGA